MAVFVISDLHLAFGTDKPMGIFGPEWEKHEERLLENWNNLVSENDTVLVPGDISWGLRRDDSKLDLDFVNKTLKGEKVLVRGNHDYWWTSVTRLNEDYDNIYFLQNKAVVVEDFIVTGSRGWICPDDKNFKQGTDKKIYDRELIRLEMSLAEGKKLQEENPEKELISTIHFPPTSEQKKRTGFTDLFEKYNVKKVYYGHLHTNKGYTRSIHSSFNGIEYTLVSCDYLRCTPMALHGNERSIG